MRRGAYDPAKKTIPLELDVSEGPRVRDALGQTKGFAGVAGEITMDADRNPEKLPVILEVEGGRFRFVSR